MRWWRALQREARWLWRRVPPSKRKFLAEAAQSFFVVLAVEVIIAVANPFGIVESIEARTAVILQKMLATTGGKDGTYGQQKVTVVLITPEFAKAAMAKPVAGAVAKPTGKEGTEAVWPLPVNTLFEHVIKPILAQKPAAMFIDLAFPNAPREITPGGTVDRAAAIRALAASFIEIGGGDPPPTTTATPKTMTDPPSPPKMVPIFLSDVVTPPEDNEQCPRDSVAAEDIAEHSVMARDLRRAVFDARPPLLSLVDSHVLDARGGYRLAPVQVGPKGSCRLSGHRHQHLVPSPALALYKSMCPDRNIDKVAAMRDEATRPQLVELCKAITPEPDDASGFHLFDLAETAHGTSADGTVDLRWSINLTSAAKDAFTRVGKGLDRCEAQFDPHWYDPFVRFALLVSGTVEHRFEERLQAPCIAIDTITPDQITVPLDPVEKMPISEDCPTCRRKNMTFGDKFLTGRAVLLGVNLTQAADVAQSPVNGQVPGVYVHAVALENMLTRGAAFPRADPHGVVEWVELILIDALFIVGLRLLWRLMRWGTEHWPFVLHQLLAPAGFAVIALALNVWLILVLDAHGEPLVAIALPIAGFYIAVLVALVVRLHKALEHWLTGGSHAHPAPGGD